ncbi:MAG: hypothetical protein E7Z67_02660 [Thermoplasmata archaeon]|nr:hypothetical protein [Thermoplasmata archaeon]
MADRRCPYCKELVPEFSVNCPRCYRDIPPEASGRKPIDEGRAPSVKSVNRRAIAMLALIPGAVGLMGLGHFYQKDYRKGLMFLCMGVVMMTAIVMLVTSISASISGVFSVVLTVFMVIMFIGTYLLQAFDAMVRSLFVI